MQQNYAHCVVKSIIDQLYLDIDPNNSNEAKDRYDEILTQLFKPEYVSNSYIAGGFINYKQNAPYSLESPENYEKLKRRATLNVYLRCGARKSILKHELTSQGAREFLHNGFQNERITDYQFITRVM